MIRAAISAMLLGLIVRLCDLLAWVEGPDECKLDAQYKTENIKFRGYDPQ